MLNKESKLRYIIIALSFLLGLFAVIFGWSLTAKLSGLLVMLFGVVLLLVALFVYNAPYFAKKQ